MQLVSCSILLLGKNITSFNLDQKNKTKQNKKSQLQRSNLSSTYRKLHASERMWLKELTGRPPAAQIICCTFHPAAIV